MEGCVGATEDQAVGTTLTGSSAQEFQLDTLPAEGKKALACLQLISWGTIR